MVTTTDYTYILFQGKAKAIFLLFMLLPFLSHQFQAELKSFYNFNDFMSSIPSSETETETDAPILDQENKTAIGGQRQRVISGANLHAEIEPVDAGLDHNPRKPLLDAKDRQDLYPEGFHLYDDEHNSWLARNR